MGSKSNIKLEEVQQIQKYINEGWTNREIAELTGRGYSSICRIRKRINDDFTDNTQIHNIVSISMTDLEKICEKDETKEEVSEEEKIDEVVDEKESEIEDICDVLFELGYNKVKIGKIPFECGLFDRHDMPVKNFIFKKSVLSSKELFDFEYQKSEIIKFFRNFNIDNNRVLKVYLSGCQTAVGSLVQVCADRKIDLYFYHYDKKAILSGFWKKQEILKFDNNDSILNSCVKHLQSKNENYIIYKSKFFEEVNEFGIIKINVDCKKEIALLVDKIDEEKIFFGLCRNNRIRKCSNNIMRFELFHVVYNGKEFDENMIMNFTC